MNILSQVKIILGLETRGFPSAQKQVKAFTQGVQRDITQLKTFVGGYFTAQFGTGLVRAVSDMVGRFKDLNETSGESLETIQKYDQVFKKFGGTAEDAIKIFDELSLARKEALEKGGEAGIKLQRLGLSWQEIQSLETGRKLYEQIAKIANDPNNAAQRLAFLDQFGKKRGGIALAGAAALAEGGEFSIISDQQINDLDEAAKAFERAALEFKIASVPLVSTLTDWIATAAKFWADTPDRKERTARQKSLEDAVDGLLHGGFGGTAQKGLSGDQIKQLHALKSKLAYNPFLGVGGELTTEGLNQIQAEIYSITSGKPMPPRSVINPPSLTEEQKVKAFAKRIGEPYYTPDDPEKVKAFAQGMGADWEDAGAWSAPLQMGPADIERRRAALSATMDSVFFRAGNSVEKQQQLREQIARNEASAKEHDANGEWDAATKLRQDNIKSTGDLADLMSTPHREFQSDQLAQLGGFIGGAGAIDPSLTVQQSQLQVLQSLLTEAGITNDLLGKLPAGRNPINDLQ